jgi:hypothetical protein
MVFATRPQAIRSSVTFDEIEGLVITIPAVKSRLIAVVLGLLFVLVLIDALICLVAVIGLPILVAQPENTPNDALALMLFVPSLLILFAIAAWFQLQDLLWRLRGREIIQINDEELMVTRQGKLGKSPSVRCPLSEVSNLRYAPTPRSWTVPVEINRRSITWMGIHDARIALDWRGQTHRFGVRLSETECRRLIKTIKDRYKIPDYQDEPLPVERL